MIINETIVKLIFHFEETCKMQKKSIKQSSLFMKALETSSSLLCSTFFYLEQRI